MRKIETNEDRFQGLFKKRPTTDPQYVTRSRQKLDSAVKLTLKTESSDEDRNRKNQPSTSSTPTSFAKKTRPEVTRRPKLGPKIATTAKSLQESKSPKFAKRFGPSKATSLTSKLPVNPGRANDVTESTTLGETDESNDLFESTTLPYSRTAQEATTARTPPTRANVLSRRAKELPRENVSTTTRRSRAWIAQHVDKNYQEPRPRSSQESSTRRTVTTTTTKRSRVWNLAYIDRNWQEPTRRTTEASETSSSATARARPEVAIIDAYLAKNPSETVSPESRNNRKRTEESSPETSSSATARARPEVAIINAPSAQNPPATVSADGRYNRKRTEESSSETSSSATARARPEVAIVNASSAKNPPATVSTDGRYTRKRTEVFKPFESVPKIVTTEESAASSSSRRREFRPRTATYRRHSEPPQSVFVVNALPVGKSSSASSVAITPKVPVKFHATVRGSDEGSTQRPARQEPTLNVKISDDSENANTNSSLAGSGIVGSSNGASGTSDSNIFSPTRSTFLLSSNSTFLDQLRSTVAPLLSALGNRTPIFSTVYNNTNGTVSHNETGQFVSTDFHNRLNIIVC